MKIRIVGMSAKTKTLLILMLVLFCLLSPALADDGGARGNESKPGISLFSVVQPLGICALSSVLVTFGTGLFRRKLGKRFLKIHRTFAWLTIGLALCHGILVLALF